jgi:hypothetical protein
MSLILWPWFGDTDGQAEALTADGYDLIGWPWFGVAPEIEQALGAVDVDVEDAARWRAGASDRAANRANLSDSACWQVATGACALSDAT